MASSHGLVVKVMDSWSKGWDFKSCHILEDVSDKASYYVEKKMNKGSLIRHTKKKFYDKKKQKKKNMQPTI